jgi:branched-chain amino acid transport system permease protein
MATFIQQIISGIAIGYVYAIVALGFVLIYKATEVVSFAQGELMMVGAFFGVTFINQLHLPYLVGAVLAIACIALVGVALDRLLIRRMVGQPTFAVFMVTVGVSTCLKGIVLLVPGWGVDVFKVATPLSGLLIRFQGLTLSADHAAVIVLATLCVVLLFAFFRYSRTGLAMTATAENQMAASYCGVNVKTIYASAWALGAGLAGLGGLLLAPITFVDVNMGSIGLKAIVAAVIGGFGSLPGAIVGGLTIGIVEQLSGVYLPEGAKDVAAYVVVLIGLAIRPKGFFGTAVRKKV